MSAFSFGIIGIVILGIVIGLLFFIILGVTLPIIMNNRKTVSSDGNSEL